MKALFKLFLAVAAGMFALSCVTDATEDLGVNLGGQTTEISISLEESRTHIASKDGDSYPLYWSEGDKIAVNGVASAPLAKEAHGKSSATFVLDGVVAYPHNIVYPAPAEGVTAAEGLQVVTFPATQNYVAGSFDEGAAPMYAYVSDAEAQTTLHHLAGVLRIAVKGNGEKLTAMTIATESAKIAGNFDIDCTSGALTAQADATNVINVNFSEPVTLGAEATPIYVALPAGQHGVMTVTLTADDTIMELLFNSTIHAGVVKEFAEVTYKAGGLAEPEGDLVITSEAELQRLAKLSAVGKLSKVTSVTIGATLDMSDVADWTGIKMFPAIPFDGGSDKGYEIKGLKAPLFLYVEGATIKNVKLTDVDILITKPHAQAEGDLRVYSGALAYYTYLGSITNCYASGKIELNLELLNADTSIEGDSNYAIGIAGLVGIMRSADSVSKCTSYVDVTVTKAFGEYEKSAFYVNMGGISGYLQGTTTVSECYNYGDLKFLANGQKVRTIHIGGVFGYTPAVTLHDKLENHGDLILNVPSNGSYYVAGVLGLPYTATKITNCVNTGAIEIGASGTCTTCYVGSIASYNQKNTAIDSCSASNNAKGKGITIACDCSSLYTGFMGKFPASSSTKYTYSITNSTNSTDLHLTSDFSVSGACYPTLGFTDTVGSAYSVLTLTNFHVSGDILFEGTASGYFYCASIIGYWRSTNNKAYTMKMTNCSNSGDITIRGALKNRPAIGGIMAYNSGNYATLTDVSNSGNITVCNTSTDAQKAWIAVGGITGYDGQEPPMTNCKNSGNITVTGNWLREGQVDEDGKEVHYPLRVGGIVGYPASFAKIKTGVVNTGNITIGAEGETTNVDYLCVGGIWGEATNASSTMTDPINTGNITITNVTNKNVAGSYVGGIVGKTAAKTTNAQSYCDISAVGYENTGMIMGIPRADATLASTCKLGGRIATANGEDGKPFFRTLAAAVDGSNGTENADGSVTELLPEYVMFYDVIYGGTTQWAEGSTYDGCTYLTQIP